MNSPNAVRRDALLFAFSGGRLLLLAGRDEAVPTLAEAREAGLKAHLVREVGELGGRPCVAALLGPEVEVPDGLVLRDFRMLIGTSVDREFFFLAGRARMISDWHKNNRYCGRCGSETVESANGELAMRCPSCGASYFPRISPAAIVLVRDGERVLLARSPGFPPGMYSTLAGFVEPGESVEETVRREVYEEVGVRVGRISYFGSQTWPFPDSLMLGFTAYYESGDITLQDEEIEDAGWFAPGALPALPPRLSIARAMIEAYLGEVRSGAGQERER